MERKIIFHPPQSNPVAEVVSGEILIRSAQEALDLMMEISYQGSDSIILYERNLAPGFFELETGLAGEVLQKFSNYRMNLAIVGDFSKFTRKSIRDFIFESNRQGRIVFTQTLEEALAANRTGSGLHSKQQ